MEQFLTSIKDEQGELEPGASLEGVLPAGMTIDSRM
jgi:hypothetical protein